MTFVGFLGWLTLRWAMAGVACLAVFVSAPSFAVTPLPESTVMIPKKSGLSSIKLETTLYLPEGAGPFPLVIINHGKDPGNPRFQARSRYVDAARFFLLRGYAVMAPMRQGFSKSTGRYDDAGCNVERLGRTQADDVVAALDYATKQPWADKTRIVVLGQSAGGWATLAFGTRDYPGVKGLINFAGGVEQKQCIDWPQSLITAAGTYGKETHVPSLWFYGDNDHYFQPLIWKAMHDHYVATGTSAEVVDFGIFGSDSHIMFGAVDGDRIWQPKVDAFLREIDMPDQPQPEFAQYAAPPLTVVPPATDFAAIDAVERVPVQSASALNGYRGFLSYAFPRAFAINAQGGWGSEWGGEDPLARALESCTQNSHGGTCQLYAVDDKVVWKPSP